MHKYSVEFVVYGDDVSESEVSGMLGLKASVFHKKAEPLAPKSNHVSRTSIWSFFVFGPNNEPEWHSLEEGLKSLIERLRPLKEPLKKLSERFSLDAYCGHFGSGFGGGPTISNQTLSRLADLRLSLTIKAYWGSNEPDE